MVFGAFTHHQQHHIACKQIAGGGWGWVAGDFAGTWLSLAKLTLGSVEDAHGLVCFELLLIIFYCKTLLCNAVGLICNLCLQMED